MNSKMVVALSILLLGGFTTFSHSQSLEQQQEILEEKVELSPLHLLHTKTVTLENQINQMCGISCDLLLKEDTWFESISNFFTKGCNFVQVIMGTGFIIALYQGIASQIDENRISNSLGQVIAKLLMSSTFLSKHLNQEGASAKLGKAALDIINGSNMLDNLTQSSDDLGNAFIALLKNSQNKELMGNIILSMATEIKNMNANQVGQFVYNTISQDKNGILALGSAILTAYASRLMLTSKQAAMLPLFGVVGFFAPSFINKISPLCNEACATVRESKEILNTILPAGSTQVTLEEKLLEEDKKEL